MKNCIQYILGLLSVCLLAGCQTTLVEQYVNLEYSELAVQGNGGTYEIGVESYDVWQVIQDECDWVEVEVLGEDSFSVNVLPNMSSEERECVIKVVSGDVVQNMALKQYPRVFNGDFADLLTLGNIVKVSSNGKYVVGLSKEKESRNYPAVCSFEDGNIEIVNIGKKVFGLRAVSGDGKTVITSSGNKSEVYREGNKVDYEIPSGYTDAEIVVVSDDGSMMAGNLYQNGSTYPAIWKDGVIKTMLPMPEESATGAPLQRGVKILGSSADCSVIYGFDPSTLGLIYWKNEMLVDVASDNATIKTVMLESGGVLKEVRILCTVSADQWFNCSTSPNGRYIAAFYVDYVQKEEGVPAEKYTYPVLIDTESGEVKIIKSEMSDAMGITADDNGLVFGGTPAMIGGGGGMEGYVFNASDDTYMSLPEWFMQNYGIVIDKDRLVYKVSSDMKTFFGMKRCNDFESWFLRIDD